MPKVTVLAILGPIQFLETNYTNSLDRVIDALPSESARYMQENLKASISLRNKAMQSYTESAKHIQEHRKEHIFEAEWYPYTLYTDLLRTLDKVIGNGDLSKCIEVGRFSAKHDLSVIFSTSFKSLLNFSSIQPSRIQSIFSEVMTLWSSYYDTGKTEISSFTANEATYLIKDFPDIDITHVKSAQGWAEQFLLLTGKFKNIKSDTVKCQYYGDPVTEIHFTFNP